MKTLKLLSLIAMCPIGTGCAQYNQQMQSEIKALETRELDLPFDQAYTASANGLFALGFTVDHSDKQSGVLTGHRHDNNTGGKVAGALLLGVVGALVVGEHDEGVSFMLTSLSPSTTQLRMKVVVDGKPVTDRTVMTKIWQQVEREAMLDSRPSIQAAPPQQTQVVEVQAPKPAAPQPQPSPAPAPTVSRHRSATSH